MKASGKHLFQTLSFCNNQRKMLLAAEMLEEKIHNKTNKLPNNESSESGGTAEETSD